MLVLCAAEHLPIALLLMPESSDFRGWHSDDTSAQVNAFLGELRLAHDVPVIDARQWIADSRFSDGHHLLKPGARQFTQRLGREWLLPWLRGGPIGGNDANR
jgi:hypothetical protein